jgi:hypothetical protein
MALNNKFVYLILLTQLLFVCCRNKNSSKSANNANAVITAKPRLPDFYIGDFKNSDLSRETKPAEPAVYEAFKALLDDKKLAPGFPNTKYNGVAITDTISNLWLKYGIKNQEILKDTLGLQQPDTGLYTIDWSKIGNRTGISLKEILDGNKLYFDGIFHGEDYSERRNLFKKAFGCSNLVFLSYPKLNKGKTLAIIVQKEWDANNHGSEIYMLKKIDGKWKLIISQFLSAS